MAAQQAPPSLGFSRQEHWSGLPFPSPMHGREKWKWSRSVVSDSGAPWTAAPTRLLHPGDFPGKSTGVGCQCLLRLDFLLFCIYYCICTFGYMNLELPDVQAGFRKGRGTRDQIASICWIIEKAKEFQKKTFISALLTMPKPLTVWITINWGKF